MGAIQKVRSLISGVKTNWNTPAEGKYIPNKEFCAYSFGGIGVNTVNSLLLQVNLKQPYYLNGAIYGISPDHLALMNTVVNLINLIKTPFVSMIIDNTKSKYGKFRPYLLYTGFPTVLLLILMAFIPGSAQYNTKMILITLVSTVLMLFQSLYSSAYANLGQVLSPNSQERTQLLSISAFIYNLGPSIVAIVFPVFAQMLGGLDKIAPYRILIPIFAVVGVLIGLWTFRDTNERIIVPKTYVAKVPFKSGLKHLLANKYFWIINLFTILGALKYGTGQIPSWYAHYNLQNDNYVALFSSIIGTASIPGMLLAPKLTQWLGKKNILLYGAIGYTIFSYLMNFSLDNPVLLIGSLYISNLFKGSEYVCQQSMMADIFDYQQYKTEQRLEGFITQFGMMLTGGFALLTELISPYMFKRYGLGTDYNVLKSPAVRTPIYKWLIYSTVGSSILSIIPLLFYNLNEKKHSEIIETLKQRAENKNEPAEDKHKIKGE